MRKKEIFPNPTVNQVIFQIRFPNLFYIENKIGDFQLKVMKEFPESSLIYRRQLVLADLGEKVKAEDLSEKFTEDAVKKIWQFKSPKKYNLNVLSDSLDLTSEVHKTYDNPDADYRFRDIIDFTLKSFFEVTNIPIITRIGLRYIDLCPIPERNNKTFKEYYKTAFPLSRFKIEDANELNFRAVIKRGDYFLRFVENLKVDGDQEKYTLDFDAYYTNIPPDECLSVTDKLHEIINAEWKNCIKDPVYAYMRQDHQG